MGMPKLLQERSQIDVSAAEGLHLMHRTLESIRDVLGQLNGGNGVLYSGTEQIRSDGQFQRTFQLGYGSVHIRNTTGSGLVVASGPAGSGLIGVGQHYVPPNVAMTINLADTVLSVVGAGGTTFGLEVFARSQPPFAGVLV